ILARDFPGAFSAVESGQKLSPAFLPLEENRAHALLFLGRVEEAEQIYIKHRGEKFEDGSTWTKTILDDFEQLEDAGLANPEFARIRQIFREAPKQNKQAKTQ